MLWSSQHQRAVLQLFARLPSHGDEWVRSQSVRLSALPIGWDLWSHWFLRPNGEVVLVGKPGEPVEDEVHTDRSYYSRALV